MRVYEGLSAWFYVMRAHDHVWRDRQWDVATRMAACHTLHCAAIEIHVQHPSGSVWLPWTWKEMHA